MLIKKKEKKKSFSTEYVNSGSSISTKHFRYFKTLTRTFQLAWSLTDQGGGCRANPHPVFGGSFSIITGTAKDLW